MECKKIIPVSLIKNKFLFKYHVMQFLCIYTSQPCIIWSALRTLPLSLNLVEETLGIFAVTEAFPERNSETRLNGEGFRAFARVAADTTPACSLYYLLGEIRLWLSRVSLRLAGARIHSKSHYGYPSILHVVGYAKDVDDSQNKSTWCIIKITNREMLSTCFTYLCNFQLDQYMFFDTQSDV